MIAWNEITIDNTNDMSINELTIIAEIIGGEMHRLHLLNVGNEHELLFANIEFQFVGMSDDVTDNGDVVYMLSLYNSMLAFSNMINNGDNNNTNGEA